MGLEIVSLILPCVKKLVCFRIPPAQAPPRHCWCHVLVAGPEPTSHCSRRVLPEGEFGCINHVCFGSASLTQLGGRYAIILLVETTAVNAPCSTLVFQHDRSTIRAGTRNPYQNQSQWLLPYSSAGMSPFGPRELLSFKHCYACTDTDWLDPNSIDQLAQVTGLKYSHYSASPATGQLKLFSASFNAILVVCISLVSLTVCTVGRF